MNKQELSVLLSKHASIPGIYPPILEDLFSLYKVVRATRATSILEIGSGWSTLVLAHALLENSDEFSSALKESHLKSIPFCLSSVDSSSRFADLALSRLSRSQREIVSMNIETPRMCLWEGRICHTFDNFPNFAADLIYLDGPDCNQVIGDVAGISVNTVDAVGGYNLPMSADLLRLEYFLQPGCQIVIDGRGANAEFLRTNFKREWNYKYDSSLDQHFLKLVSPPWGKRNRDFIAFSENHQLYPFDA